MRIRDRDVALPAREGARVVALGLLAEASRAAARLAAGEGDEPLHDFRVAVRRLRTALRSLRPWLEDRVPRRKEKQLKEVARATNAARDAEVQLAWLATVRGRLSAPSHRRGLEHAVARYEGRRQGAPAAADVAPRFRKIAAKLRRRLGARAAGRAGDGTFAAALASLVREHASELASRVEAIRDAADVERAHRARIAAKRLRYLLEPLRGYPAADAAEAIGRLKRLQDVLGDLHDAHVLGAELGSALAEAAAERARRVHAAVLAPGARDAVRAPLRSSPRPGLLALARLVRDRRDGLFGELERAWRREGVDALAAEARAVAAALDARAARAAGSTAGVTRRKPARRAPGRKTRRRASAAGEVRARTRPIGGR